MVDIQTQIATGVKELVPIEALRALAGNAAAFGADVIEMYAGQAERRAVAAGAVLTTAETESRDILASEQRSYDRHMREAEQVRGLQRDVEARTAARGFVPASAAAARPVVEPVGDVSPVLAPDKPMAGWLESRGGYHFHGEQGAASMRLGAFVHAMATGNRSRLSDLERRALSEGVDASGGFTVPEVVSAQFIDRVRADLVVQRAGAQIVPMTSDTLHLARIAQPGVFHAATPLVNAATGGWKLENDLIVESDLALERATLVSRTLPLLLKLSVELFEDSANVAQVVEAEMAASTALELDRVALVGTGTAPEPRGILNQAGVLTGVLGVPTDWDFLVDAAGQLWTVNESPNAAIYGPATAVMLAKFKTVDGQPLQVPSELAGVQRYRTTAAGARVFVGDFSQLLIGVRTQFRIEVTRVGGTQVFDRLQVAVRSYVRADVAVARAKAFTVLSAA